MKQADQSLYRKRDINLIHYNGGGGFQTISGKSMTSISAFPKNGCDVFLMWKKLEFYHIGRDYWKSSRKGVTETTKNAEKDFIKKENDFRIFICLHNTFYTFILNFSHTITECGTHGCTPTFKFRKRSSPFPSLIFQENITLLIAASCKMVVASHFFEK